jgi:hypothetical protein
MDVELLRSCEQLATTLGTAFAAKPLLEKMLGPSFAYVGNAMAGLLERFGNKNVAQIFIGAARTLSDQEREPRHVNPRVLRAIIEDGCFAADEVTQQYYAGLLASAFSADVDDDRVLMFTAALRHLTPRHVQAHHVIYALMRNIYSVRQHKPLPAIDSKSMFVPYTVFQETVGMEESLRTDRMLAGLIREDVISSKSESNSFHFDGAHDIGRQGWLVFGTTFGAELFLWVHGARDAEADEVLKYELHLVDWAESDRVPIGVVDETGLRTFGRTRKVLDDAVEALTILNWYEPEVREALSRLREHEIHLPTEARRILSDVDRILEDESGQDTVRDALSQCSYVMSGLRPATGIRAGA